MEIAFQRHLDIDTYSAQQELLTALTSKDIFGFTVGATGLLIRSILRIRQLGGQLSEGIVPENLSSEVADIYTPRTK